MLGDEAEINLFSAAVNLEKSVSDVLLAFHANRGSDTSNHFGSKTQALTVVLLTYAIYTVPNFMDDELTAYTSAVTRSSASFYVVDLQMISVILSTENSMLYATHTVMHKI